jgi:hypothetical protein
MQTSREIPENNKGTKRPYRGQVFLSFVLVYSTRRNFCLSDTRVFILKLNALETLQGVLSDYRSSMFSPHVMNLENRGKYFPFVSKQFLSK